MASARAEPREPGAGGASSLKRGGLSPRRDHSDHSYSNSISGSVSESSAPPETTGAVRCACSRLALSRAITWS